MQQLPQPASPNATPPPPSTTPALSQPFPPSRPTMEWNKLPFQFKWGPITASNHRNKLLLLLSTLLNIRLKLNYPGNTSQTPHPQTFRFIFRELVIVPSRIALSSDEKWQKSWLCLEEIFSKLWFLSRSREREIKSSPNFKGSDDATDNFTAMKYSGVKILLQGSNKQINIYIFERGPRNCELHYPAY